MSKCNFVIRLINEAIRKSKAYVEISFHQRTYNFIKVLFQLGLIANMGINLQPERLGVDRKWHPKIVIWLKYTGKRKKSPFRSLFLTLQAFSRLEGPFPHVQDCLGYPSYHMGFTCATPLRDTNQSFSVLLPIYSFENYRLVRVYKLKVNH